MLLLVISLILLISLLSARVDASGMLVICLAMGVFGFSISVMVRTWGPQSKELALIDLATLGGGFYFGLGTIIALKKYWLTGQWSLAFEQASVIDALLMTLVALSWLQFLSMLQKRLWRRDWAEERASLLLKLPITRLLLLLVPVVWVGRFFILWGLGYGMPGLRNAFWYGVGPWAFIGFAVTSMVGPGILCLLAIQMTRRRVPALWLLLFALEIAWVFLQGRRVLVVSLAQAGFVLLLIGWRPRKRHAVATFVMALAIYFVAWPLFFQMRAVGQETHVGDADAPIVTLVLDIAPEAWQRVINPQTDSYTRNVVARSFVLSFLAELAQAQRRMPSDYMRGAVLQHELLSVVPRILWIDKQKVLGFGSSETEISRHYRLTTMDRSSTWIALGFADGGGFGILIYGLILVLFVEVSERMLRSRYRILTIGAFLGYCQLGVQLMQVENSFATYLVSMRNLIMMLVLSPFLTLLVMPRGPHGGHGGSDSRC